MSTTDTFGAEQPPARSPGTSGHRRLRRSRTNRVAAGVSSGLGEYFGVDPVLFRVLFATSAFFAGAGILAYLLAWAAIPEAETERAPIDGWVGALRRHRIPVWLVVVLAGLLLWLVSFSWWMPGPVFPVIVVIVLLVVLYGRREMQARGAVAAPDSPAASSQGGPALDGSEPGPVNLTKPGSSSDQQHEDRDGAADDWTAQTRVWLGEAREAGRQRRRRALPVRIGILAALTLTLLVLGLIDAVGRIELQVYFWSALTVLVLGLLVGLVTRRTPVSMFGLLIPVVAGTIAFAGSHTSLHDGFGHREWRPTTAPAAEYRLAAGQGVLDLRSLSAQQQARTIRITAGAGQIKIIAPRTLNLTVHANVHIGAVTLISARHEWEAGGFGYSHTVGPVEGATGPPITVHLHLADGNITISRR